MGVVFPPKAHDEVYSAGYNEETGEELDDKFTAHALEMGDGDWVIARLTVNYLTEEDAELSYQLSAENDFSSEPVFYDFGLEFNAKPIPTTTTTTTTTKTEGSTAYRFMTIRPHVQAEG